MLQIVILRHQRHSKQHLNSLSLKNTRSHFVKTSATWSLKEVRNGRIKKVVLEFLDLLQWVFLRFASINLISSKRSRGQLVSYSTNVKCNKCGSKQ